MKFLLAIVSKSDHRRLERDIRRSFVDCNILDGPDHVVIFATSERYEGVHALANDRPARIIWGHAMTLHDGVDDTRSSLRLHAKPTFEAGAEDLLFDGGDCVVIDVEPRRSRLRITRAFPNGRDLYYMPLAGRGFACSSHAEILVQLFPDQLNLDLNTLISVFRFGAPALERTLFESIRRPHAGTIVEWSPETGIELRSPPPFDADRVAAIEASIRDQDAAQSAWEQVLESACGRFAAFYEEVAAPQAITLSGGVDSSLALALIRKSTSGHLSSVSITDKSWTRRTGEDFTEHEAIEFLTDKFHTSHQFYEINEVADADLVRKYADTCFDAVGSALEFYCFLTCVQRSGIQTLATGYCADGLMTDFPDHSRVTREIQHRQPERMLFELRQFIQSYRLPRGLVRRVAPWFMQNSYLYAYYPMIDTISTNEILRSWFRGVDLKRVNDEFMIADDYVLSPFGEVDALRLFLLSDFNKIGMNTKQRIEKACRMTGLGWWSPYWDRDAMETALAIPIEYRNKEHTKNLTRLLVDKHIGPEMAFRGKFGFSKSFARLMNETLDMRTVVLDGKILDRMPWRSPNVKARLRNDIAKNPPPQHVWKLLWNFYWLERTTANWDDLKLAKNKE